MQKTLEHEIVAILYDKSLSNKDIAKRLLQMVSPPIKTNTELVEEFHAMTGQPHPTKPCQISKDAYETRLRLINEELNEYMLAYDDGDLIKMADALADLKYVVIGTEVAHGFPGQEIFNEVHRSNMTKKDGFLNESGKWEKGPSYEKPELELILTKHGWSVE
jgi:predicted HAD superfamily Cof-like phosphohydrolase